MIRVEFLTNDMSFVMTSLQLSSIIHDYNIKDAYNTLRLGANRNKWIQVLNLAFFSQLERDFLSNSKRKMSTMLFTENSEMSIGPPPFFSSHVCQSFLPN